MMSRFFFKRKRCHGRKDRDLRANIKSLKSNLIPEYPSDKKDLEKYHKEISDTALLFSITYNKLISALDRYLDKNEDTLWDNYSTAGYDSTIKNDRAEWIEVTGYPHEWTADDVKSIEYIEIYAYTNTLHGAPDYEFTNPVLIKVSDFVDWDKVTNN